MIRIRQASIFYRSAQGIVRAVDDVSFDIFDNEIVGIAGESGCGKSTLLKGLYGYIESPMYLAQGRIELVHESAGQIEVLGHEAFHRHWWKSMTYVPQASMSVLNPVMRIKHQFLDSVSPDQLRAKGKNALLEAIAAYLQELDLSADVLHAYPHQLSGGMRQRVIVALATFVQPQFVFADEPTTALDVVVQRGILTTLRKLQNKLRNTLVMVSHDMGVHYQTTDRMVIMYAGQIVEIATTDALFARPQHPYTETLIRSLPRVGDDLQRTGIQGRPPSLLHPPQGCRFAARCPMAEAQCSRLQPPLQEVEPGHWVACWLRRPETSLLGQEGGAGK